MLLKFLTISGLLVSSVLGQASSTPATSGINGPQTGHRMARVSDITGDGIPEYVVSRHLDNGNTANLATTLYSRGAVEVRDGASDLKIWERLGSGAQEFYGRGLGTADWNGDGILDVVAVAQKTSNPARVDVLDGSTGAVLVSLSLPAAASTGEVGTSVSGGDIDNDGLDEIVIGTSPNVYLNFNNFGMPGNVVIFSPTSAPVVVSDSELDFGRQVRVMQDVDFDGKRDILVTAPYANSVVAGTTQYRSGLIRVMSGASLATIWQVRGPYAGATMGLLLEVTPDLNSDFLKDIAAVCLASGANPPPSEVRLLSASNGSTLLAGFLSSGMAPVGSLQSVGDIDGDGYPELAVPGLSPTLPHAAVEIVSLQNLRLVDRLGAIGAVSDTVNSLTLLPDTNGNGWPELLVGAGLGNSTLGAVVREELRPALSSLADGSTLHDLLVVDGSAALPSRRVDLAIGQPFTIGVDPDLTTGQPTDFIIWGLIGVPNLNSVFNVTGGSFLFPPRIAAPALPWLFTLTDSIGFDPAAAFPGYQAPWSIGAPFGIGMPIDLTFQGVTISGGNIDITNGILLSVR